ncbi:MAG: porin [Zoogloeaceae bacterium]|jgi:predicted porin|nr:porin [Zoogloeaceae bacterium]
MQKKLIALAVASATLASGAAMAQTNVQIYGSVDVGLSHRGDNIADDIGSKNSIDSGISSGNRLGFQGTEDLGNGLKALFTLEAGFKVEDGEHTQGGRLFGRQAFLGLTGNFGTFIAGRLYTPHYSFLSAIDPFKGGTVGRYRNVFTAGVTTDGENLFDPTRVDNAVAYVSPSWSGFNVTLAFSNNAIGQEATENAGDERVWAILPRYTNGPVDVGFSYHRIKTKDADDATGGVGGTTDVNITNWAVGGTYNFGSAKLHAFYDENKFKDINAADDDLKLKSWLLGVTVPFGKHAIQASYTQSKLSGFENHEGKARQWALGYTYAFSKRTNFYAAIADITNKDDRDGSDNHPVPVILSRIAATAGDSTDSTGSGYQNGFQFGIKHTF